MRFLEEFALNLRETRVEASLTQKELAQQVGVSVGCIGLYETAKRMPNIRTVAIMSDVLGVSLDDLVPHACHVVVDARNQTSIFDLMGDDEHV